MFAQKKIVNSALKWTALLLLLLGVAGCSLVQKNELTITWSTESEIDLIGFNIYRSETPDGPFVKINSDPIPPAADPFIGGDHVFVDRDVVRGQTYYYQLETIDRNGNNTRTDAIALTAGS